MRRSGPTWLAAAALTFLGGLTAVGPVHADGLIGTTLTPEAADCSVVINREGDVIGSDCAWAWAPKGLPKTTDILPQLRGTDPADGPALMTMYADANYGGKKTTVYGQYGTCDGAGYGYQWISYNVGYFYFGVSSYKLYGRCNLATYYTGPTFSGTSSSAQFGQNYPYVGATWNDKIQSIRIRDRNG